MLARVVWQDPVSGKKLKAKDLIRLHFHKNKDGNYHCPMTFKVFGPHTRIVAIRTSGHVYAYQAVKELCLDPRNYKDLLTETPFKKSSDLIDIQDPEHPELRDINRFHFVQKGLKFDVRGV